MEGCDQPFEAILKTYISVPGSIRPSLFWIYTFIDLQFIIVKTKLKVLFFLFWGSCLSCCSHSIVVFKFFICVFIFMSDCQPCFLTSNLLLACINYLWLNFLLDGFLHFIPFWKNTNCIEFQSSWLKRWVVMH